MSFPMARAHYRLIAAFIFICLYIFLCKYYNIFSYLHIDSIQKHQLFLIELVQNHYYWAVCAFISCYSVHGALALPATSLFIITGGFLFGAPAAICYSLIASVIGGTTCYLATRFFFGTMLHARYSSQLAEFNGARNSSYAPYLLMIRIIPIIPFCLANILCGLALVDVSLFIWTLIIGILPSLIIYGMLGSTLSTMQSLKDILTPKISILLSLITILTIIPVAFQYIYNKPRLKID